MLEINYNALYNKMFNTEDSLLKFISFYEEETGVTHFIFMPKIRCYKYTLICITVGEGNELKVDISERKGSNVYNPISNSCILVSEAADIIEVYLGWLSEFINGNIGDYESSEKNAYSFFNEFKLAIESIKPLVSEAIVNYLKSSKLRIKNR